MELILPILLGTIGAGTPLIYAACGELITEKSGVLNLGVEGMMLIGAVAAFATALHTGSYALAILAGAAAGSLVALIFAFLTLTLYANQVASGLAITIFGVGFSAFVGQPLVSVPLTGMQPMAVPGLSQIPFVGTLLFNHNLLVYGAWLTVLAIALFLSRTRAGLVLRAVGESPEAANAIGYPVVRIRYGATLFGGALAGVGGAYLSIAYTPMWAENMTAGRGWIALALVVFSTWRPARIIIGAYLFGGVTILQFHVQGFGIAVPSEFLSALPYLATVLVLVLISRDQNLIRLNSPVSLGKPWHASR